jgi:hypothetical protein
MRAEVTMCRERTEAATVRLTDKGGLGVFMTGELFLTAAHVMRWDFEGGVPLEDFYVHTIETREGETFPAVPLAVEPVSDIAVLEFAEAESSPEDGTQFDAFRRRKDPVPLYRQDLPASRTLAVFIYTHKETWVPGTATQYGPELHVLCVEMEELIEGGTSGGPVVNEAGDLVAVASNFIKPQNGHAKCTGTAPPVSLCLPTWVYTRIDRERNGVGEPGGRAG